MSEMEERIARAIWDAQYPEGTSWGDWAEHTRRNPESFDGRDTSRQLARAAIEAMREPTEDMLLAGNVPEHVWHAMIDEALK